MKIIAARAAVLESARRLAAPPLAAVHVCEKRDIVCGSRPELWCATCPLKIAAAQTPEPARAGAAQAELKAAQAENAKLLEDAERYRWLREQKQFDSPLTYPTPPWPVRVELNPWPTITPIYGAALDAEIDAARAAIAATPEKP